VIPEIDIWRAANLILKRYGEKAIEESEARADDRDRRRLQRRSGLASFIGDARFRPMNEPARAGGSTRRGRRIFDEVMCGSA
jgi:hypothetical protein